VPTSTVPIGPARIAGWLARGARDLSRAPLASLAHGLVFTAVALLAAIGTAWVGFCWLVVRASVGSGAAAAGASSVGGVDALLHLFADERGAALFVAWLVAGGLVAAIVFAIGVVSVPMLLERHVPLRDAVLASVRVVGERPFTMALWAAVIMLATLVAAITVVGWVLVVPLLGHASWYAYRDLVGEGAPLAAASPAAR